MQHVYITFSLCEQLKAIKQLYCRLAFSFVCLLKDSSSNTKVSSINFWKSDFLYERPHILLCECRHPKAFYYILVGFDPSILSLLFNSTHNQGTKIKEAIERFRSKPNRISSTSAALDEKSLCVR